MISVEDEEFSDVVPAKAAEFVATAMGVAIAATHQLLVVFAQEVEDAHHATVAERRIAINVMDEVLIYVISAMAAVIVRCAVAQVS